MKEYLIEVSEYPDSEEKRKLKELIEKEEVNPKKRYLFVHFYGNNIPAEKIGSLETVGKDGISIRRPDGSIYAISYSSKIKIKELKEETSGLVAEVLKE